MPLCVAGADARKTVAVRAPYRVCKRIQALFRRRVQVKAYADLSHKKTEEIGVLECGSTGVLGLKCITPPLQYSDPLILPRRYFGMYARTCRTPRQVPARWHRT